MATVDELIRQANQALNRVKILRRGRKLALRGTLPCRDSGRGTSRAVISLGIYANPAGVKVAIAKAQRLESDLNLDRFDWADWLDGEMGEEKTAAAWGAEFGVIKAATIKPQSYRANYEEPLASLPEKPLTEDMLIAHVLKRSPADSWGRKNDCMVFRQVAKLAGVAVDFSSIRGRYSPALLSPDDVPTDEEIEATWRGLNNPAWAWVYGMLATYGLRPHEVFRIAPQGLDKVTGRITILEDSKTGRRDVWPLPERWRSLFDLDQIKLPNIRIEGRDNQELGERIGQNLCNPASRKIPHNPYALRHAWAIRSAVMGVPDSIAARWMGHSVAVHAKTYHAAIDQLQHEAIWRKANQAAAQGEEK